MTARAGACWRPWGIDALATIVDVSHTTVRYRFDHDPARTHGMSVGEFFKTGRLVRRAEYERGKNDAALAALEAADDALAVDG